MRSWIWGGALATLTALGVSWSVAPPRPTECALDTPAVAPVACPAPAEVVAVTDAIDVLGELRAVALCVAGQRGYARIERIHRSAMLGLER